MDHSLEDGGQFGEDLGLAFWGQLSPDVVRLDGHNNISHSSAREISSCKAESVNLLGLVN
ncbi:MAG: hypothetical protein PVF74_08175 [Anaerolineales bacterium]